MSKSLLWGRILPLLFTFHCSLFTAFAAGKSYDYYGAEYCRYCSLFTVHFSLLLLQAKAMTIPTHSL